MRKRLTSVTLLALATAACSNGGAGENPMTDAPPAPLANAYPVTTTPTVTETPQQGHYRGDSLRETWKRLYARASCSSGPFFFSFRGGLRRGSYRSPGPS